MPRIKTRDDFFKKIPVSFGGRVDVSKSASCWTSKMLLRVNDGEVIVFLTDKQARNLCEAIAKYLQLPDSD